MQILTTGSKKPHLQTLALFTLCSKPNCSPCVANQIRLEPEWIPGEVNLQADLISRIADYDDWR